MDRRRQSGLIAVAAVVALVPMLLLAGANPSVGSEARQGRGWGTPDRVPVRGIASLDVTNAGAVLAIGQVGPTFDHPKPTITLAFRDLKKRWIRAGDVRIGELVSANLASGGGATIISQRGRDVLVSRWVPRRSVLKTRVLLDGVISPNQGAPTFDIPHAAFNARGDVAVWVTHEPQSGVGVARRVELVRRVNGDWERPMTVRPNQYGSGSALRTVDLAPHGRLVGAFSSGSKLDVRSLRVGVRNFGQQRRVTSFASAIAPTTDFDAVTLDVGHDGGMALIWSASRETPPSVTFTDRFTVLPRGAARWQRTFGPDTTDPTTVVAGANGNVTFTRGVAYRWRSAHRDLIGRQPGISAANARGDVVLGTAQLWPVSGHVHAAVRKPVGYVREHALTADRRVYVIVTRDDKPGAWLFARQL